MPLSSARVVAVEGEGGDRPVADGIGAEPKGMVAARPVHGVAEGGEVLIERPVGVAPAGRDAGERPDGEGHLPGGVDQAGADDGAVGGDFVRVEADAREELSGRLVGPAEEVLNVETAA